MDHLILDDPFLDTTFGRMHGAPTAPLQLCSLMVNI